MLRYGFQEVSVRDRTRHLIRIELDQGFRVEAGEQHSEFEMDLRIAKSEGSVLIENREIDGVSLAFDFRRAFLKRDASKRQLALRSAVGTLTQICNTRSEGNDPLLKTWIGSERFAEGRLGMSVELQWPDVDDCSLQTFATNRMREVAGDLKYASDMPKRYRADMVYAWVERARGMELQTNPVGSCSIGTDGSWYEAEDETVRLTADNIYDVRQQIICLTGAIAIAHADELVNA